LQRLELLLHLSPLNVFQQVGNVVLSNDSCNYNYNYNNNNNNNLTIIQIIVYIVFGINVRISLLPTKADRNREEEYISIYK
jgi:hypothetical protein